MCFFLPADWAGAQPVGLWHGQQRVVRYRPEGDDFVIVNGTRRFNRALYGTNTAFRVEAGDLPEVALYMPGMGGCFRLGLVGKDRSRWLINASHILARYRPGSMIYEVRDALLGKGVLIVTVLALADGEGFVLKVRATEVGAGVRLLCAFGGATGKKFSRDGDIGADPESSFYLNPSYCTDNRFDISGSGFSLSYGGGKKLEGVFPADARLQVGDASRQGSPADMLGSTASAAPVVVAEAPMASGERRAAGAGERRGPGPGAVRRAGEWYFLVGNGAGAVALAYDSLPAVFDRAEAARKKLAGRVVVRTPDPYINTLGGALGIAADGIWEDPSYLHGAVAWRQRLPAWRGPYVADPLGWHDRARKHFSSYALSQVTSPDDGPVIADTGLHLARQLEKMGTALFSSGYICRNPGGDIRPHHYDMNLVFIDELLDHFCWTGDTAFVREMWPVIKRHLAWEKRNFDADGDGLYDAYCCIWASDALEYGGGGVTHSSAYNYRANAVAAELAVLVGEDGGPYRAEADKIRRAINTKLWMSGKGSYAEYVDWAGPGDGSGDVAPMLHPAAGLWTIYQAIDSRVPDVFQAWQALHYIDTDIPHIPVRAKGLEDTTLYTLATTNWQPYTWSINNVVLAESLHTALAYWQGGRADAAWPLWKGALVESMYLGASPGNFQQLSFYDAVRGELYRDFADPIGMAARSLVEGLFGIRPDVLHDTLTIQPGWPMEWGQASLRVPDITLEYVRREKADLYNIDPAFSKKMNLVLRLRARTTAVGSVRVNGKTVEWAGLDDAIGGPMLQVVVPPAASYHISVTWRSPGDAVVKGDEKIAGGNMVFERMRQGDLSWWMPKVLPGAGVVAPVAAGVPIGHFDTVSLAAYFNDEVTNIFKHEYRSPRPVSPTLQLPLQGIGNWCYPLATANIDDAGLRAAGGEVVLPSGVPLATPSGAQGASASGNVTRNIIFTSRWDNYPDSVVLSLSGKAKRVYFLLAGSTNPMQSHVTNGMILVRYTDGAEDSLALVNPGNWWPIEQDYYEDGFAFTTGAPHPVRLLLKTGRVGTGKGEWTTIKGFTNTAIDGGAATVLDMPLRPGKQLDKLVLRATARDVVVGLMSVTLLRD